MRADDLAGFAEDLFGRFRANDLDGVGELFADDGEFHAPALGLHGTFPEVRPALERLRSTVGQHRHDEVRWYFGADGFVDTHVATWADDRGAERTSEGCAVVRVVEQESGDGFAVASFTEYGADELRSTLDNDLRERCHDRLHAHVRSEFTNDIDAIVETISREDVYFVVTGPSPDGIQSLVVEDLEGARQFYVDSRRVYEAVSSTSLDAVTTDWYSFRASVGHLRKAGETSPDAPLVDIPSATLFPVAPDGIIGELSWTKYDLPALFEGERYPQYPVSDGVSSELARRNADAFERFVDAWVGRDAAQLETLIDDDCLWARRVFNARHESGSNRTLSDRSEVVAAYMSSPPAANVEVITKLVSDWYVFAEYRFDAALDAEMAPQRLKAAALYPLTPDGRLKGEFSYIPL